MIDQECGKVVDGEAMAMEELRDEEHAEGRHGSLQLVAVPLQGGEDNSHREQERMQ